MSDAGERQVEAERSAALSEISGITIGLIAAIQNERGLGQVALATRAAEDRERYASAFEPTDIRIDARRAVMDRHVQLLDDAGHPSDAGAAAALGSIDSIRSTILAEGAEGRDQLYADIIEPLRHGLVDQVFLTPSQEHARLRRGMTGLLTAMEATGRRGALVATIIAQDRVLTQDDVVQLSILERDFVANVSTAATMTSSVPATADGVELGPSAAALLDSQATRAVRAALAQVVGSPGDPPGGELSATEWLALTRVQVDDIVRVATALNDEVTRRATRDAGTARSQRNRLGWLLGSLFAVSLVAGAAAILASRERTRALAEHRALLDGVRRWFRRESLPDVPGVEFEVRYQPAAEHTRAGGDWYDVLIDPDGGLLAAIGDVAGHGPDTVSHVAELRNILRGVAQVNRLGPARILETVDATARSGRITTILLVRISADLSRVTFSRGGHLPAILRRADGTTELLLGESDLPMGVDPSARRHEQATDLRRGDALVLYTDGLIEHRNAYLPDEIERLRIAVGETNGSLADLADRLDIDGHPQGTDDSSLLVIRR